MIGKAWRFVNPKLPIFSNAYQSGLRGLEKKRGALSIKRGRNEKLKIKRVIKPVSLINTSYLKLFIIHLKYFCIHKLTVCDYIGLKFHDVETATSEKFNKLEVHGHLAPFRNPYLLLLTFSSYFH